MSVLTTHVGSLPRTQEIVDFIFAREKEQPYDQAAFDAAMTAAVSATVARQKAAGAGRPTGGQQSKVLRGTTCC